MSNHERQASKVEQASEKNPSPLNMKRRYEKSNGPGSMTPLSCVQSHEVLAPIGKGLIRQSIVVDGELGREQFHNKSGKFETSNPST